MLKTLIPPPVYAVSVAGLMWLLDRFMPLVDWLSPPWNRIGLLLIGLAILLDLWSLGLFFRAKTTFNPMKPANTEHLVESGLYRYTRNPMYVGMLLMLSGWWLYLGSLTPVLLLPLFVLILNRQQILPEEEALTVKFGQTYLDYQRQVRRWLW